MKLNDYSIFFINRTSLPVLSSTVSHIQFTHSLWNYFPLLLAKYFRLIAVQSGQGQNALENSSVRTECEPVHIDMNCITNPWKESLK